MGKFPTRPTLDRVTRLKTIYICIYINTDIDIDFFFFFPPNAFLNIKTALINRFYLIPVIVWIRELVVFKKTGR